MGPTLRMELMGAGRMGMILPQTWYVLHWKNQRTEVLGSPGDRRGTRRGAILKVELKGAENMHRFAPNMLCFT